MPRKNKVHISVIQVQELNENKISTESPTPLEELNPEIPRTTGKKAESNYQSSFLNQNLKSFKQHQILPDGQKM